MKQYILPMFALTATAMLLPSCSNDDIDIQTGDATVTLSATLPESLQTRAFGDGHTAKHLKMVVLDGDKKLQVFAGDKDVLDTSIDMTANVDVKLVTGKTYTVICWADADNGNSPYTFNTDTYTVTANYKNCKVNEDRLDAFYAAETFTVEGNGTQTIKLTRPFAQLNIGTDDLAAAKAAGFTATTAQVSVPVYTTLNLRDGSVSNKKTTTFGYNTIQPAGETFPTTGYDYLTMNYVLTGADKELVDVTLTVKPDAGSKTSKHKFNTVPVQRNYRTNIYGSILTNDVNVQVVIEPNFDDPDELYDITAGEKLVADLAEGGNITLASNADMPLTAKIEGGKEATLNLNGKTIFNTNDLWDNPSKSDNNWSLVSVRDGANLTIKGDGTLKAKANDCYAVDVQDGSTLTIEGGHYVGNIHAVYVEKGTAIINGGTFEVQQKYPKEGLEDEFVLNCLDANRADGTAKIIVTGGKFINFNPADCQAEGAHTNFVADGYASILVSTSPMTYEVKKATEVADATSLRSIMASNGGILYVNEPLATSQSFYAEKTTTLALNEGAVLSSDNSDARYTATVSGTANITITGAGGKIVGPTFAQANNTSALRLGGSNSRSLTIYGNVTVDGSSGSKVNNAIYVTQGVLKIYGGVFRTGVDANGGKNAVILLNASASSWTAKCYIYGGVFECEGDASYLLNIQDETVGRSQFFVCGGTFVGFNPANNTAEGKNTNFVAPGYKSVKTTWNGKEAWKVVKE